MSTATAYSDRVEAPGTFDEVVERTRAALAEEGFGVLSEIDVQATMKAKLGVDREPYLILGACNPPLAHRALQAELELGALLPCNVVVFTDGGATHVSAVSAERMLGMVDNPDLEPVAREVGERLGRVLARVRRGERPRAVGAPRRGDVERRLGPALRHDRPGLGRRAQPLPGRRGRGPAPGPRARPRLRRGAQRDLAGRAGLARDRRGLLGSRRWTRRVGSPTRPAPGSSGSRPTSPHTCPRRDPPTSWPWSTYTCPRPSARACWRAPRRPSRRAAPCSRSGTTCST